MRDGVVVERIDKGTLRVEIEMGGFGFIVLGEGERDGICNFGT